MTILHKKNQKTNVIKGFLHSYGGISAMAIIVLKASVFQAYGMENPKGDDLLACPTITVDSFDVLLAQSPNKSRDEMLQDMADELMRDNEFVLRSQINHPEFLNQILLMLKNDIFGLCQQACEGLAENELKILHTYDCNSFVLNFKRDVMNDFPSQLEHLRYGIAHYNTPLDKIQESYNLAYMQSMRDSVLEGFNCIEPAIAHYATSQLTWDGVIPDDVWNQMLQSEYRFKSGEKLFTETQRTNIVNHLINKAHNHMVEKYPQFSLITNDFLNKHESLYAAHNQKVTDLLIPRIQSIIKQQMEHARLQEAMFLARLGGRIISIPMEFYQQNHG